MTYNALTRRYFEAAAAAGLLGGTNVHRGSAGDRRLGTWVQFDVLVQAAGGENRIADVRFQAFGCPHVIAIAAWVAERSRGGVAVAALPESIHALRERFAAPVYKLGRLLILEDAWLAAMAAAARGGPASAAHD